MRKPVLRAGIPGVLQTLQSPGIGSCHATKFIVALGQGRVQAHAHVPDPGLRQKPCHLWSYQGSIGGDYCAQAHLPGVKGQCIEVAA